MTRMTVLHTTNQTHLWVLAASVILAALVIAAIVVTIRAKDMSPAVKGVWLVVLVGLPGFGLAVWAIARLVAAGLAAGAASRAARGASR